MNWLNKIFGKETAAASSSEDFEITLGPEWEADHQDTHFCFNEMTKLRQIIISVLRAQAPISKPEYYVLALEQIAMRQTLMQSQTPLITFSEPICQNDPDKTECTVFGSEQSMPIQAAITTIANSNRIVVFIYYNYNAVLPDEEFKNESAAIRGALKVF